MAVGRHIGTTAVCVFADRVYLCVCTVRACVLTVTGCLCTFLNVEINSCEHSSVIRSRALDDPKLKELQK